LGVTDRRNCADEVIDKVKRRLFCWLVACVAIGLHSAGSAQQLDRKPVIGMLMVAVEERDDIVEALRQGLRQLGYVEGKDFSLEFRSAKGDVTQLPALAKELVRLNVDVIITGSDAAIRATRDATNGIPIVMAGSVSDPVVTGLIESFNHPGGNLTGSFLRQDELNAKRLELLKQMLPNVSRVAVLVDKFGPRQLDELRPAARALSIKLEVIQIADSYDFEAGFTLAKNKHCGAAIFLSSPAFFARRARIGGLARNAGLPVVSPFQDITRQGGLMSYGADVREVYFRAAYFVDRILKGAKPSDLPIDQVSTLKMLVNLRTAKALGITIPESILLRADEVVK